VALVTSALTRSATRTGPGPWVVVRRNFLVYRKAWVIFLTGFAEPVLYLFSIGVGVGQLVDGFTVGGRLVPYAAFVAPGMLAASSMNGALLDATFGIFFKLRYDKVYEGMLATPMSTGDIARGELVWSLLRSSVYALGFLGVMAAMGLLASWWALLAWPATWLIGFAFAGAGMAATTYMRSWQDFDLIQLTTVPMFLFSATFFPVTAFSGPLRVVVELTPLYRGVALVRELTTGTLSVESAWSVLYLAVMGTVGVVIASRRFDRLLLT